jgi:hypothetical protein
MGLLIAGQLPDDDMGGKCGAICRSCPEYITK